MVGVEEWGRDHPGPRAIWDIHHCGQKPSLPTKSGEDISFRYRTAHQPSFRRENIAASNSRSDHVDPARCCCRNPAATWNLNSAVWPCC